MKNSFKRLLSGTLATLMLVGSAFAAEYKPSKTDIELPDGTNTCTFDVSVTSDRTFAGVEFGLKPSNKDVKLSVEYIGKESVQPPLECEKNGVYYFGVYSGDNIFAAGEHQVATVTCTYAGDSDRSIQMVKPNLTYVVDKDNIQSDKIGSFTVNITREKPVVPPTSSETWTVPVKMMQSVKHTELSMGNDALDGPATVTFDKEKNQTYFDINLKAVDKSGLHGHLLKMWHYPTDKDVQDTANAKDTSIIKQYEDVGMDHKTPATFPKVVRVTRNGVSKEDHFYIRISVDAMAGFDQDALLTFDWDHATKDGDPVTPPTPPVPDQGGFDASIKAPVISPNGATFTESQTVQIYSENGTKIYYTTDGSNPVKGAPATQEYKPEGIVLNTTTTINAVAYKGNKFGLQATAAFVKQEGQIPNPENPENPEQGIVDGYYYVDITLVKKDKNEKSIGDVAFDNNRQALITVEDGRVTEVQMGSNPVQVGTVYSGIVGMKVNGSPVRTLATKPLTTKPAGNAYQYISEFSFKLPANAQPGEALSGSSMIPVGFKVPDTPMGDGYMEARLRFDWGTAVKTKDDSIHGNSDTGAGDSSITGDKIKELYLRDSATGIEILTDTETLSDKAKLSVTLPTSGKDYEAAQKALNAVGNEWKLYKILTTVDGKVTDPSGSVSVSIPCSGQVEVYRINDNGSKVAIKGMVKNGKYIFNTSKLGLFAVVSKDQTNRFLDMPGHWAEDDVNFIVDRGLFKGTSENLFSPDMGMTRAMFVTVLARLNGADLNGIGNSQFQDVPANEWYTKAVAWAAANGVVNGTSATTFTPNAVISRQDMAVILNRYAEKFHIVLKNNGPVHFADAASIAPYAQDAVARMASAGLINGVGHDNFAPLGVSTRAQVATLLARFIRGYSL